MPLVQGGPPEWVWERTADFLKAELVPVPSPEGQTVYELRVSGGREVLRVHFFTHEEIRELAARLAALGKPRCVRLHGLLIQAARSGLSWR